VRWVEEGLGDGFVRGFIEGLKRTFVFVFIRSWSTLLMWRTRIRGQLNEWRGCSVTWRGRSLYCAVGVHIIVVLVGEIMLECVTWQKSNTQYDECDCLISVPLALHF
jgi:heme/copper-type cytochrome/quinol oxidase subunit 3